MKLIPVTVLCLLGCSQLQAAPATVLSQDYTYQVSTDGTWTMDVDSTRRIDEAAAITALGQAQVQYSESLQTVEILEAYTVTKAGMRIDVPADKILTQQLPASSGAPTFSDTKVKNVVFPQVEIGATLTLHFRLKQLKPFLPGVFSAVAGVNPFLDTVATTITLRAPEKLKLYMSSRDMQGGEVKSTTPGQREWRWTYGEKKAIAPEPGALLTETFSPYAAFSTLETYPQLAQAYMIGAEEATKVTPAVQKLADEITAGITDKRAQADALYRWVSTQIRYVAIYLGPGGYVPHKADEIIAARYGDCKDKSTLLNALLHAKGIRAMPVLIHTAETFKLPDTVLLGAFNHAITYLPDWDVFVDSTGGFSPFGVLTSSLQNKQALLGGDKSLRPVVRTTPTGTSKQDRIVQKTTATVTAAGAISGASTIDTAGSSGPDLRATLGSIPEAQRPAVGKALLASSGQSGDATLTMGDARDLTKPFSMTLNFTIPQFVAVPGPGALPVSFGTPLLQSFVTSQLRLERKLDFPCPSGAGVDETVEMALPPQLSITNLPKPATIESPYGRFTSSLEFKDGRLLLTRRLELDAPRPICTAADSAELRKFATAISQQLRAQVLYQ